MGYLCLKFTSVKGTLKSKLSISISTEDVWYTTWHAITGSLCYAFIQLELWLNACHYMKRIRNFYLKFTTVVEIEKKNCVVK